jgi:hypothetical protein
MLYLMVQLVYMTLGCLVGLVYLIISCRVRVLIS